jgi:hypothetical protein
MKIAVCMSGQPRTWEKCVPSIKKFIECDSSFQVHYFGHTWTQNSWKVNVKGRNFSYEHENLEKDVLIEKLQNAYSFTGLTVDSPYVAGKPVQEFKTFCKTVEELASNSKYPIVWNSMSYSAMMSNFQKQQFENKNDIKFDIVVKLRLDQAFDPNFHLTHYIKTPFRDDVLYCEEMLFKKEFLQQSVNDVCYFGSSRVMDIVENFYRVYHNGRFFDLIGANYFDGAFKNVGYGVLLYKWLTIKNIYPADIGRLHYQVVRRNTSVIDPVADYSTLIKETGVWVR